MKTAMIARFVLGAGAIFAAAGLVGCGAGEQESSDPGAIGSTSEALSVANKSQALSPGAQYSASCKILDGTTETMILAGGFNVSGTALDTVYKYTVAGGWSQVKDNQMVPQPLLLGTARGQLRGIQDPADTHTCWFVGGAATIDGAAINPTTVAPAKYTVDKLSVSGGVWTLSHFNAGTTPFASIALTRFEMRACPATNKIAVFGGFDNTTTEQANVLTFDRSTPTTAWAHPTNATLNAAVAEPAVAQDKSGTTLSGFVVAGGLDSSGVQNQITLLKTSDCATWTNDSASPHTLPTAVKGPAAFVYSASHDVVVAAGKTAAAVVGSTAIMRVDWSTSPPSYVALHLPAAGTALANGYVTYRPQYVQSTDTQGILLGGVDTTSDNTTATDAVQETYVFTSQNLVAASSGRAAGVAEVLSNKVYFGAGFNKVSTKALETTTDEITP